MVEPPIWKDISRQIGSSPTIFGVQIPKIFEKQPPRIELVSLKLNNQSNYPDLETTKKLGNSDPTVFETT